MSGTLWLACALVASAPLVTPAERAQRLDALKAELTQKRAALSDLDNRERSVLLSLGELDETLARIEDEAVAARVDLDRFTADQTSLHERNRSDEQDLAQTRAHLQARLRALYLAGEGGTARALLGAEGFFDLALRRRLLTTLAADDVKLVDDVAQREDHVRVQRALLLQAEQDTQRTQEQLDSQRLLVLQTRQQREVALSRITQEKSLQMRAQHELELRRGELGALVSRLSDQPQRSPFQGRRALKAGQLLWPVVGTTIRRYGVTIDKDSRAEIVSNGLEIRADDGAPVAAAADGHVVHVGWLRGFGRVVLIDHGGGHHTLSAHLSRSAVAIGDDVRRGQTIGFVGDTESTNGPKLYFELRENGRPRDPSRYFADSRR